MKCWNVRTDPARAVAQMPARAAAPVADATGGTTARDRQLQVQQDQDRLRAQAIQGEGLRALRSELRFGGPDKFGRYDSFGRRLDFSNRDMEAHQERIAAASQMAGLGGGGSEALSLRAGGAGGSTARSASRQSDIDPMKLARFAFDVDKEGFDRRMSLRNLENSDLHAQIASENLGRSLRKDARDFEQDLNDPEKRQSALSVLQSEFMADPFGKGGARGRRFLSDSFEDALSEERGPLDAVSEFGGSVLRKFGADVPANYLPPKSRRGVEVDLSKLGGKGGYTMEEGALGTKLKNPEGQYVYLSTLPEEVQNMWLRAFAEKEQRYQLRR